MALVQDVGLLKGAEHIHQYNEKIIQSQIRVHLLRRIEADEPLKAVTELTP